MPLQRLPADHCSGPRRREYLIALEREDGASYLSPTIATAKASGALATGMGGRELARKAAQVPMFVQALMEMTGGGVVPVPGRRPLPHGHRSPAVGDVGASGDTPGRYEECAVAGIASADLVADAG